MTKPSGRATSASAGDGGEDQRQTSSTQHATVAAPVRHHPVRNATGGLYCPLCCLQWPCFQADRNDTTDWQAITPGFTPYVPTHEGAA